MCVLTTGTIFLISVCKVEVWRIGGPCHFKKIMWLEKVFISSKIIFLQRPFILARLSLILPKVVVEQKRTTTKKKHISHCLCNRVFLAASVQYPLLPPRGFISIMAQLHMGDEISELGWILNICSDGFLLSGGSLCEVDHCFCEYWAAIWTSHWAGCVGMEEEQSLPSGGSWSFFHLVRC